MFLYAFILTETELHNIHSGRRFIGRRAGFKKLFGRKIVEYRLFLFLFVLWLSLNSNPVERPFFLFRAFLSKSSFAITKRQPQILQNWSLSVLRFIYSAVRVLCDRVGVHMGETSLLAFTKPYGGMRLFRIICTTLHTRIYGKQGRR